MPPAAVHLPAQRHPPAVAGVRRLRRPRMLEGRGAHPPPEPLLGHCRELHPHVHCRGGGLRGSGGDGARRLHDPLSELLRAQPRGAPRGRRCGCRGKVCHGRALRVPAARQPPAGPAAGRGGSAGRHWAPRQPTLDSGPRAGGRGAAAARLRAEPRGAADAAVLGRGRAARCRGAARRRRRGDPALRGGPLARPAARRGAPRGLARARRHLLRLPRAAGARAPPGDALRVEQLPRVARRRRRPDGRRAAPREPARLAPQAPRGPAWALAGGAGSPAAGGRPLAGPQGGVGAEGRARRGGPPAPHGLRPPRGLGREQRPRLGGAPHAGVRAVARAVRRSAAEFSKAYLPSFCKPGGMCLFWGYLEVLVRRFSPSPAT
mmetsp:Transcript_10517/g.24866  ORF Transcript_10517/g.24866 Transcript_10517/m.24866 type:complete len:376 (-) Transcript_10517:67-1194(-)